MIIEINFSLAFFLFYQLALIQQRTTLAYSSNEETLISSCYDSKGKPIRCSPDFVNAAYNRTVISSNTCGSIASEYCVQSNLQTSNDYTESRFEKCDICDMNIKGKGHPADYLIDYSPSLTWWQSDTIEYDIQYPNSVNISIHLGKTFDITYVQIKFYSSRPESFAIYKRTNETSDWVPYQYYSASCEQTYNKNPREIVYKGNEALALCSDEFSDIAPLSGASIAFSTLESRPSAYNFENSEELKDWVTASDIRLTLNRLNTFGDEVFGDPRVLRSYYYAISDISIGGKCKCNGHAEKCIEFEDNNLDSRLKCKCEHNTNGIDCEKCAPFFNDRPWAAATFTEANECLPCNCNGLSDECVFNSTLYETTGHGGYCINCRDNTEGTSCENCKHGFFRKEYDNQCRDCMCHKQGSVNAQCDPMGVCRCKPGVTGDKCDRCEANHYGLDENGCKKCQCNQIGSVDTPAVCDQRDGKCRCKAYVEGHNCDSCKPGFFNLDANLPLGCLSCFCFGHSSECKSSSNHIASILDSDFNNEQWTSIDSSNQVIDVLYDRVAKGVFIYNKNNDIWFNAPKKYLGNQRNSYNQNISFRLKFGLSHSSALRRDLIIEGNGKQIHRQIYDSIVTNSEHIDDQFDKEFTFKLRESEGWNPSLSSKDFHLLLSNLTSIRIKATYGGNIVLSKFNLQSAKKQSKSAFENDYSLKALSLIEECSCPPGHSGQFCENCQIGFRRETAFADSFTKCVPCSCNNHSISCNPTSGKCNCIHHTIGENCELCQEGYYGDALFGTPTDCKKCPCPNDGSCVEIFNHQSSSNEVVCLNCPEGTRGNMCDLCEDGYSISSKSDHKSLLCEKCVCNANIDENAIGNCDSISGRCLRCTYNTTGDQCEKCLPDYWGNALSDLKCHACECYEPGSENSDCNLENGQCKCKPNVIGRQCDQCKDNYWKLTSGEGCTECKCDPVGSISLSCDTSTGQCGCQPGVTGLKCDKCLPNYFNLSSDGCKKCECNAFGSLSQQCNHLGHCKCKVNIAGDKCDKCEQNFFNFTSGCNQCAQCYDLVQNKVANLTKQITSLKVLLDSPNSESASSEANSKNRELSDFLTRFKNEVELIHEKVFDKNNLKSNYKESIKHSDEALQQLTAEFKKLNKPSDIFVKQVDEMIKLMNVTLASVFNNIKAQEASSLVSINSKKTLLNSVKTKFAVLTDEYLEANNPSQLKLKNLASKAREESENQKSENDKFSELIASYITSSKAALSDLNEIIFKKSRLQLSSNDINYEQLIKNSQTLVKETNDLKKSLDVKVQNLQKTKENLNVNQFNENKYDNEIGDSNSKVETLNSEFKDAETNIGNLTQKTEKYFAESSSTINDIQTRLTSYKTKNDDLNNLLDRSDRVKNVTDESIKIATDSYKNASNILNLLESFDAIFSSNKDKAAKSQSFKEETLKNLDTSKQSYAKTIKSLALSKQFNLEAANSLESVRLSLNESLKKSSNAINETQLLSSNTRILFENLTYLDKKKIKTLSVLSDAIEVNDQLNKKIEIIQSSTDRVVEQSQNLLNNLVNSEYDLDQIEQMGSSLIGIKLEDILRLEKQYDQVFKDFDLFDKIEKQLNDLNEAKERNQQELKIFEREIPNLTKQINELNLIELNLRSNCDYSIKKKLKKF